MEEPSKESASEAQPPPPALSRSVIGFRSQLEELKQQSNGKLHWTRTPLLLSQVWDTFTANKSAVSPTSQAQQPERSEAQVLLYDLADKSEEFRTAAVQVHTRWANLQPLLEELLALQDAEKLHAQRTPQLLEAIESEVEGLEAVHSKAWQQLSKRWKELENALEELVAMKERNKLHVVRASELLSLVTNGCSKGLSNRHAEAVADIQFRWTAIHPWEDGLLRELRLMEKSSGLHWRRTPELLQLLDEQCEGFTECDAIVLKTVRARWETVKKWHDEAARMQFQDAIDCKSTALILKELHLLDHSNMPILKQSPSTIQERASLSTSLSPVKKPKGAFAKALRKASLPDKALCDEMPVTTTSESARLEQEGTYPGGFHGLVQWFASEEAAHELKRVPYYRITTDVERDSSHKFSKDGMDSRLLLPPEETVFTRDNVRRALMDRGMIPRSCLHPNIDVPGSVKMSSLPKDVRQEILELEAAIENEDRFPYALASRERLAELHLVIEGIGKGDLLWNVEHVVNTNQELQVPSTFMKLLSEMLTRGLSTIELRGLMNQLVSALRKETLKAIGVDVPGDASSSEILELQRKHQIEDVLLPRETAAIQTLLQERSMDSKGEPVYLRGQRIGTQCSSANINTGLGIVDTQIEALRHCLLIEAFRKRSSLIKTFTGDTQLVCEEEPALEVTEVNKSDDFIVHVERFQQLLIHESYTQRLAEYAALDRCMRAFVGAARDQIVTKEDITAALKRLNAEYRLPVEAFTQEEHVEIAVAGEVLLPSTHNLARCPRGENAKAMAYYAAMSYAAMFYQDTAKFRDRLDRKTQRVTDSFYFDGAKDPETMTASHLKRLMWASAVFTLRNRWFQRGFGWCDSRNAAGVKILLESLLVVESTGRMHMAETDTLLREITESCVNLDAEDKAAKERLEKRYDANLKKLKDLRACAEKCAKNQKLSTKDASLLSSIEQACIVPDGLNKEDKEAYGIVKSLRKEPEPVVVKTDEVRTVERKNSVESGPNEALPVAATTEIDKKSSLPPSKEALVLEPSDAKSLSPLKPAVVALELGDKDALPPSKQVALSEPNEANAVPPPEQIVAPDSKLSPESPRRKSTLGAKLKSLLRSPSKRATPTPSAPTASIR